jgi:hypothetical protein
MQALDVLREKKKEVEAGERDHRPASDEGGVLFVTKRKCELKRIEKCIWEEKAEISTCKSP